MAEKIMETGGNNFAEMERSILSEILGAEEADKVIAEADAEDEEFDAELQELIDSAPDLDEAQ